MRTPDKHPQTDNLHGERTLRILFVDHSGAMGGGQLLLDKLVDYLPFELDVALLSGGPMMERLRSRADVFIVDGGDKLVTLGKETTLLSRLWATRRLPRIIAKLTAASRRADVVYANSKKSLLYAALAARRAGRPLIWHQHDEMRQPATLPIRSRLSESLLIGLINRYATRVISVSQAAADTLVAAGGRSVLPVVVHNGVDATRYTQTYDRRAVRRAVGLPEDVYLLGCFGRLTELKGQAVLINALISLPHAHAVLVGGEIFAETGYEATLRAQVERLGLMERVHFLGHRNDVPALMQAVDVLVHTSIDFESFGLVIAEGMLSERPVVATAVGGVPELIENGVSGLLVPPGNAPALAEALQHMLDDREYATRLAMAGRKRALERFTLDRMVNSVTRIIREVVCEP